MQYYAAVNATQSFAALDCRERMSMVAREVARANCQLKHIRLPVHNSRSFFWPYMYYHVVAVGRG